VRDCRKVRQANRAVRHRRPQDRPERRLPRRFSTMGGTSATRGLKDWGDGSASTERLACLKKKKSRRLSTSSGFLVFGLLFYRRQKRSAPRAMPSMVKVDPCVRHVIASTRRAKRRRTLGRKRLQWKRSPCQQQFRLAQNRNR
jgi:hypothetical protein